MRKTRRCCKSEKPPKKLEKVCCLKACIKQLEALNAKIANLESTNIKTTNLNVTNINGNDTNCLKIFQNNNAQLNFDPLVNPGDFNDEVWDRLVAKTLEVKEELKQRLKCGRLREKYYQDLSGCVVCPPNELTECIITGATEDAGSCCGEFSDDTITCFGLTGSCPPVENEIFGSISLYPYNMVCDKKQLLSTVSYNLDVINVTTNLATRVVSVLVHAGYLDFSLPGPDKFVYEQLDFGNRQFGPTLDPLYGEKYTGTIVLPTDLITRMSNLNKRDAIVQLVVFNEDGLEVDVPFRIKSRDGEQPPTGAVDTQASFMDPLDAPDLFATPEIKKVEPTSGKSGDVIKITGPGVCNQNSGTSFADSYKVFLKLSGPQELEVGAKQEGDIYSFTIPDLPPFPEPINGSIRFKNPCGTSNPFPFTFIGKV